MESVDPPGWANSAESRQEDTLPLPVQTLPLLQWLEGCESLTDAQACSILFIVRLADLLHGAGYVSFLNLSVVQELGHKLNVAGLQLEVELNQLRWSYVDGTLHLLNHISINYDGDAMQKLTGIAQAVLHDKLTPEQGLKLIEDDPFAHHCYRRFPGRAMVFGLSGATIGVAYFGATFVDVGFGAVTGLASGGIVYLTTMLLPSLAPVQELLASVIVSMIATGSLAAFPNRVCFTGQVLGTLVAFFYGYNFMISLYEITSGNLSLTGMNRLAVSILNTFVLAAGVVIGIWMVPVLIDGENRGQRIIQEDCSLLEDLPSSSWLFLFVPLSCISMLMELQIAPRYWIACLTVQLIAYGSQYVLEVVLNQPFMVSNIVPAYLSTVAAHLAIVAYHKCKLTSMHIPSTAYRFSGSTTFTSPDSEVLYESRRHISTRTIQFVDDTKASMRGYRRSNDQDSQYQRSDLWFCLVPALFVLVPGSSVWRIAFFSILESTWSNDYGTAQSRMQSSISDLIAGVLIVGMSQAIGVRLGLTTLSLASELVQWSSSGPSREVSGEDNSAPMSSS